MGDGEPHADQRQQQVRVDQSHDPAAGAYTPGPHTASKWEVWFAWRPVEIYYENIRKSQWVWFGPVARRRKWLFDSDVLYESNDRWEYGHYSRALTQK